MINLVKAIEKSAEEQSDDPFLVAMAELRELRKQVTFAVYSEEDDLDKVTATVESLFMLLEKAFKK